jgi:hypothetical protein
MAMTEVGNDERPSVEPDDPASEAPLDTDTPTPEPTDARRTVSDGLVRYKNFRYEHPILLELDGCEVRLRPASDDERELHVFVDGRWEGIARRTGLSPERPGQLHATTYVEDDHRSLDGARLVQTENFIVCDESIASAARDMEMAAVYGEAGLGKTYAAQRACVKHAQKLAMRYIRIALRQSTSGGGMIALLLEQLYDVHLVKPSTSGVYFAMLTDALNEPTLVHIDEAQYLSAGAMHQLRHLDDLPHVPICIVLSGGNSFFKVLSSDPMLHNRVPNRVPFRRFREDEIPIVARAFHPMFEDAGNDAIHYLDDTYGKGVFRNWRHIARKFQTEGLDPRSETHCQRVLVRLGVRGS